MASVSWNARDQLGRVVEVTSDTVADVAPPGPEALETGGDPTPPFDHIQETEPENPADGDTWLRFDPANGVAELLYYDAGEGYFFGSVPTRMDSRFAAGKFASAGTTATATTSQVAIETSQGAVDASVVLNAEDGAESSVTLTATSVQLVSGLVMMPNLPTSDPSVAGALWSDTGTLKVSAG